MNNFINKVFCMDNLTLLSQLPDDSIDLIYCDILYGTGRDFGDYKDIQANKEDVYSFYYPRFLEMARVLSEDGVLALQMDYRIVHWVRCMAEDLGMFLINDIVWHYKKFSQNNNSSFIRNHDYILVFANSSNYTFNPQFIEDANKKKRINKGYFNCGSKRILVYDFKKFNKWAQNKSNISEYKIIDRTDDKPLLRRDSVFHDINFLNSQSKERVGYETQKPKELVSIILSAFSNAGDVVADFFCGSGTTPVVAKELGRQYIACDIEKKAVDITKERLSNV